MHRSIRTAAVTAGLAAAGAALVATPALAGGAWNLRVSGPLSTWDANAVPNGAGARVHAVVTPADTTIVTLTVEGLEPNEPYGAHAHADRCSNGKGGGHVKGAPGPVSQDTEVWLDFVTNAQGRATATAQVSWPMPLGDGFESVIIHADLTSDGTGDRPAGTAGPKLACLNVQP